MGNKNVVIYCRVSTKEQAEEGNSLITQEKICREYAMRNGFVIAKIFIEFGESAKTANRTQLQNMLKFCSKRQHHICEVIVYKVDRLARNVDDYSNIRMQLKYYGIVIRSTSEKFDENPAGRFMENILANVAQFDNDVRTERSVNGMKEAVRSGRYIWPAPFGYVNSKMNGHSTIIKDSTKSLLVRESFELLAAGESSIEEIMKIMAAKGLKTSKSTFYKIVRNKIYYGLIEKFSESNWGTFEKIVSFELFQKAQLSLLTNKRNRKYKKVDPEFPLRQIVRYPFGPKLTASWSTGKSGKKFPYYRFPMKGCNFNKTQLENTFIDFLNDFSVDRKYLISLHSQVKSLLEDKNRIFSQGNAHAKKQIENLQKERSLILRKNLQNLISDDWMKYEENRIALAIIEQEDKIKSSETDTQLNYKNFFQEMNQFLLTPGLFWKNCSEELKGKLQTFIFPKGITFDGNKFETPKTSLFFDRKTDNLNFISRVVNHSISSGNTPEDHNLLSSDEIQAELLREYYKLGKIFQECKAPKD